MSPIQLEPNPADRFGATTPEAAKNNTRYALLDQVRITNAARVQDYETQWKAYAAARDARPGATNLVEPVPPMALSIDYDSDGWPYIYTTPNPVATLHVYAPPKASQSSGGFSSGASLSAPALGLTAGELLAATLYGKPLQYAGMLFLRVA